MAVGRIAAPSAHAIRERADAGGNPDGTHQLQADPLLPATARSVGSSCRRTQAWSHRALPHKAVHGIARRSRTIEARLRRAASL